MKRACAEVSGVPLCRLPSASDANAAREEDMLVGRTLSVPWIRGESWAGTQEELEEAWAAEVSRGYASLHAVGNLRDDPQKSSTS